MAADTWLITGGVGYIGSHVAETFLNSGKKIVLLDNLDKGSLIRWDYLKTKFNYEIPLAIADIRDTRETERIISHFRPIGIIHTAGLKSVTGSFKNPFEYEEVNYRATQGLLNLSKKYGVMRFILSSTAAVYGSTQNNLPILEDNKKNPISPYGKTKLMAEIALQETLQNSDVQGTALRFFNVIGTSSESLIDRSKDNLLPILFDKISNDESPTIFGKDHGTPDGTCIRDYVDVRDVARSHLLIADKSESTPSALNIASGMGYSVIEVLNMLKKQLSKPNINPTFSKKRQGEIESVCADISRAKGHIGFTPLFTIEESIRAFCSFQKNSR